MMKGLFASLVSVIVLLHQAKGQSSVTLGLDSPALLIDEGNTFLACFTLSPDPTEDTEVNIQAVAEAKNNIGVNQNLTFSAAETLICINITIIVDNIFSGLNSITDIFEATIFFPGQTPTTMPVTGNSLLIDDKSMLEVSFERSSYTFVEDVALAEVCVVLAGSTTTSLATSLTVAAEGDPFTVTYRGLTLEEDQRRCYTLGIDNDALAESQQTFNIVLTATVPLVAAAMNIAVVTLVDDDGDCGSPPSGNNSEYSLSGPSAMSQVNELVTNEGAVATYTCEDGFMFSDENAVTQITCVLGTSDAMWDSSEAPACEKIPTTEAPTTLPTSTLIVGSTGGLADNTNRNIGIGVGVGVGGALLIILAILLIVGLIVCCKKGQRHSKYVLNYDTTHGVENRKKTEENAYTKETPT